MKQLKAVVLLTILSSVGCNKATEMKVSRTQTNDTNATAVSATAANATAPAAEKTYPMTATIVSRDPGKNTLYLDNKEVPGEMPAMKMDYELRGARVATAPRDGSPVVVTVHDRDGSVWITDVKK
jgi:uncharacterized protein GlcG (DUF336 family)